MRCNGSQVKNMDNRVSVERCGLMSSLSLASRSLRVITLAAALTLTPERHSVSFQSRLGRTPWIRPYTDEVLPELARRGIKRLAVLCPAFVADCLETVEEIGIRGKEQWHALGGEAFVLVPSLNAHPVWVEAVADMIRARA